MNAETDIYDIIGRIVIGLVLLSPIIVPLISDLFERRNNRSKKVAE